MIQTLLYTFTGGLGMPSTSIGIALSLLGVVGLMLQLILFLIVYIRLGTVKCFQLFFALFSIGYAAMLVLALLLPKTLLWVGIISILSILVAACAFILSASIVFLNNCSPHSLVLGTVYAIGQSVSAIFRTTGSIVGRY